MSGVYGDWSELRRLRDVLHQIADGSTYREIKALVGGEAAYLAFQSFETQTDPFGERWEPSARAVADAGLTLVDKGRLRNSIAEYGGGQGFIETPNGIQIGTNVVYGATHNYGDTRTHNIRGRARTFTYPRRQFIPTDSLGSWGPKLDAVIFDYLNDLFGG